MGKWFILAILCSTLGVVIYGYLQRWDTMIWAIAAGGMSYLAWRLYKKTGGGPVNKRLCKKSGRF